VAQTDHASLVLLLENRPGGVYFLHGAEGFLREEALARIVGAHLDPATRDFNLDNLRGDEVTAEALASILATPPMMAEWRVVVLRDAQQLGQKAREVVETVAAAPPAGLVFAVSAVIPSGSKAKFYSTLQRTAISLEFRAVDPNDAPGWAIDWARSKHGMELLPEGARALVTAVGADLRTIVSELEKLATFVGPRERATAGDVEAVTGKVVKHDRWQWFDLVSDQNFSEALRQLPFLLQAGESGVGLVIGLGGNLVRIGLVCAGGAAALERELKPYQRWLSRRIVPQARRWSVAEVDRAMAELLRADRLLKSASLSDRQVMEELLLRLEFGTATAEVAA
jgi:DNA polymerase III subunit delta